MKKPVLRSTGRAAAFLGSLAFTLALAYADHRISHHPSLILFYVAPLALATWFCGPLPGYIIAVFGVCTWFFSDVEATRELYRDPVFFYFTMVARAVFLLLAVYVLGAFKAALAREKSLRAKVDEQNRRLVEFDERKSAFVGNVSHELQSPLAIAVEYIDLILGGTGGALSAKHDEMLRTVRRRIERLIRLVRDLLDLSRIEAGKLELRHEDVDVAGLLRDEVDAFRPECARKGILLRLSIRQEPAIVRGDRDKLTEVVTNLLHNAAKYTPSGGTITLDIVADGREVRWEVCNTGPVIAPEDRERIFDKFERIKTEKMEGTGLGLPIARDIVLLHHGRLWVTSEAGRRNTFIVVLPQNGAIGE